MNDQSFQYEGNNYEITIVKDGIEPVICVINGFLSESNSDVSDWLSIVDILYPHNKVVHFDWPAGNAQNLLFTQGISIADELGIAGKAAAAARLLKTNPVTVGISSLIDRVAGRWQASLENAERAGSFLADIINDSPNNYVLMGHSLGARVSYYALNKLDRQNSVESALLFGGAITHTGEWQSIFNRHPKLWISNSYSHNDSVLRNLYRLGTLFSNTPIGLKPISANHQHLYNFNTSEYVSGHTGYKCQTVGNFLAVKFGEIQELEALSKQFITNAESICQLQTQMKESNNKFEQALTSRDNEQQRSLDAINRI